MVFSLKAAAAIIGLVLFFIDGFSQKLSFYEDVQPLIHSKCATCHRPGGGAPFNLITYEDVSGRAKFIRKVITSRYMPNLAHRPVLRNSYCWKQLTQRNRVQPRIWGSVRATS